MSEDEMFAVPEEVLGELKRYREREPLVQALLSNVRLSMGCLEEGREHWMNVVADAGAAVQAFKIGGE